MKTAATTRGKPGVTQAVAKALILAAWADGIIHPGERQFLNTYFDTLPGLTQQDITQLHAMMLDKPLQSEALLIFSELRKVTILKQDRDFAISAIQHTLNADGIVSEDELGFLEKIKRLISGDDESFYQEMGNLIREMEF